MSRLCPRCAQLFPEGASFCPNDGAALVVRADPFLGKTIAARYRLTKRLGSGGMSVVYLARHEVISRLSAIKILRPELSRMTEHRERFLREARAVNRINHQNIVEITDVGESDGVAYLVMEYVEGESLLAHIHKGPLDWERALRIAVQVASALARTHQTGIIHRDLKPENILLVPQKDAGQTDAVRPELVKLTDFGIAKMSGEPTLTLNEQLFGTPGYIAPEYVNGAEIDGRADLYSLGVVTYEMVTGQLPFEGRGQSELLLKPLTSAPIPPSKRVTGLPPDLEVLLLRCLARDPKHRPHDAFALQDAFVEILRRFGRAGRGSERPASPNDEAPLQLRARSSSAPPVTPRESLETVFDRKSSPRLSVEIEAANVNKLVTSEMSARWASALVELETAVTRARRAGGASEAVANRAAELAIVAAEMVPRVERAAKVVAELQAKVDRIEAEGREFRGNLGHAIDVLVHDRSRETAHLDALRTRREALQKALSAPPDAKPDPRITAPMPDADPRPWELEAVTAEETRAGTVVSDLDFQIATLQKQLDAKNESHEVVLLQATGTLEGSLSALRHLTGEVARTIDDGIEMLERVR